MTQTTIKQLIFLGTVAKMYTMSYATSIDLSWYGIVSVTISVIGILTGKMSSLYGKGIVIN